MSETNEATKQERQRNEAAVLPAVDVIEDENGVTLMADLPGVSKENLTVRADGEALMIEGQIALETPSDIEPVHVEMQVGRYRRIFNLSRDLDASKSEAALNNGVLKLRIPKAEHAQPRKVEVKIG